MTQPDPEQPPFATMAPGVTPSLFADDALLTEDALEPQKLKSVKKPVQTLAFIPVDESRLTLTARKVFNVLMHMAQEQGGAEAVYRSRLCEIIEGIDLNSNNTQPLKDTILSMVSTVVVWQSPTKSESMDWTASALVSQVNLKKEGNEFWIEWSYSPIINKSIHTGKPFARIGMDMQNRFKTFAGLALYEIALRYINVPGGKTASREWAWWRPVLVGEREDEPHSIYRQWKYFYRDVVQKAKAEVNAYSDIHVEAIITKRGRSVHELQFKVKRSRPMVGPPPVVTPVNMTYLGRAANLKIPTAKVNALLKRFGEDVLSEALTEMETIADKAATGSHPGIGSPYPYLMKVLEGKTKGQLKTTELTPSKTASPEFQSERGRLIDEAKTKFVNLGLNQKIALEEAFENAGFPSTADIRPSLKEKWQNKEPGERSSLGGIIQSAFFAFVASHFFPEDWATFSRPKSSRT